MLSLQINKISKYSDSDKYRDHISHTMSQQEIMGLGNISQTTAMDT